MMIQGKKKSVPIPIILKRGKGKKVKRKVQGLLFSAPIKKKKRRERKERDS